jgi:uncharacterized membrane protein (DUF485 family)
VNFSYSLEALTFLLLLLTMACVLTLLYIRKACGKY